MAINAIGAAYAAALKRSVGIHLAAPSQTYPQD